MFEQIDVLCIGYACTDLTFNIDRHPKPDEKLRASGLQIAGGGPAANAAVAVARLGGRSGFIGALGKDAFGDAHLAELVAEGVDTSGVIRYDGPSPLASVYVKPIGSRSIIDYRSEQVVIRDYSLSEPQLRPKVILFDGHQPKISLAWLAYAKKHNIPTILDAGSIHKGTKILYDKVDYLVASEKFAVAFSSETEPEAATSALQKSASFVASTWGEKGVFWTMGSSLNHFPAFSIQAVDTNGAGDAFHGAFAYYLSQLNSLEGMIRNSSAVGAITCMKHGARSALPTAQEVQRFLSALP